MGVVERISSQLASFADNYVPSAQDNAATMKVQLDAQRKATDQLVSNTR